jgi:S-adenosylmethionine:tRNA ribosyltransferase-isomerase
MDVALFDFDLPDDRIALRPVTPRDTARMLVVDPLRADPLVDASVRDLPACLRAGDVLVLNNTRVIPSRLYGRRGRAGVTAGVEIMLHKRLDSSRWLAFARPARKLVAGDTIHFGDMEGSATIAAFSAQVLARGEAGEVELAFSCSGPDLDAAIAMQGELPLPPYIAGKRPTDARDSADYQTVYAAADGAVAAPTAGLHFTEALFATLREQGIGHEFVTLHVGAGTFLPVKAQDTSVHQMHAEWGLVPEDVAGRLNRARASGGRIVAVGTTALRLLESAAAENGRIDAFCGDTAIFITPGYRFRAVDLLMTNFHLPRSTLFMLVSAFSGLDLMHRAYAHAIRSNYRFYSYGDACLLSRAG